MKDASIWLISGHLILSYILFYLFVQKKSLMCSAPLILPNSA